MKKYLIVILFSLFFACNESKNIDYVTLSGKIDNAEIKKIAIGNGTKTKIIDLNEDGIFNDTLIVEKGLFTIKNGKESAILFLANKYDLNITADANNLFNSIKVEGIGEENNNYIFEKNKFAQEISDSSTAFWSLEKNEFNIKLQKVKSSLESLLSKYDNLDSLILNKEESNNQRLIVFLERNYEKQHEDLIRLARGKPSPKFKNYINHKGGTSSLDDFKGKYVYISIWTTFCKPFIDEVPFLKKVEESYKDNNIVFVSISVDSIHDQFGSKDEWVAMVNEMQLGGVQLFADNDFKSQFIKEYNVKSIPRFILIDPSGNIVESYAERPSDPNLIELFTELGI